MHLQTLCNQQENSRALNHKWILNYQEVKVLFVFVQPKMIIQAKADPSLTLPLKIATVVKIILLKSTNCSCTVPGLNISTDLIGY